MASGFAPGPHRVTPWWFSKPVSPARAERGIDVRDDLADAPPLPPPAANVEQPEPGDRLAFHAAEPGPDDLVAGADREDHRAAGRGRGQPSARHQAARGQDLRQVLTAAEQVDVPVDGHPLVGVDLGDLDSEAAQPGPPGEYEQVARSP